MDKRGDVATIMIVAVAFALVIISLLIFLDFKAKFQAMEGLDEITVEVDFGEKYIISEAALIGKDAILDRNEECQGEGDLSYKFKCNAGRKDYKISLSGNFFAKIERHEFNFVKDDSGNYLLDMKGLKIKSERGASNIERNFDLEIRFDSLGEVSEVKRAGAEKT